MNRTTACSVTLCAAAILAVGFCLAAEPPRAIVEVEEDVYTFARSPGVSGAMWCYGNSCINRIGQQVFASGVEAVPGASTARAVHPLLFERTSGGWQAVARMQTQMRTGCPLVSFPTGTMFLSANPTFEPPDTRGLMPARPEVYQFSAANPGALRATLLPKWEGKTDFTDHSYRSFAADGPSGELFLNHHFNFGHEFAQWSFRDKRGQWSAQGRLDWPWGAEYPKPQPIRVAYPTVALKDRAVYFFGVGDIPEPYPEWKEFKRKLNEFAFDFRRLFFTWSEMGIHLTQVGPRYSIGAWRTILPT